MIETLPGGITLVGTAHISARSVADVEKTIREQRPAQVLVELDSRRMEALADPDAWQRTDLFRILKEKKQHLFLLQLYLASMQARMGRETGVAPGGEMLKAIEVARDVGAEVVLMDRDVGITLKRAFASMGFWQKAGLAGNVLMEMMPAPAPGDALAEPATESQVRNRALGAAAVPVAILALLAALPAIGRRAVDVTDRVFDAFVGISLIPALTLLLAGLAAGILAAVAWPGNPRSSAAAHLDAGNVARAAWAGLLLGLLGSWFRRESGGLGQPFLDSLWHGLSVPAAASIALCAGLGAAGAVMGFRFGTGLRGFVRRRQSVVARGGVDIDSLLETDTITKMTEEFAAFAPQVKHALIDERDAYMASRIASAAKAPGHKPSPPAPGTPPSGGIVAVLGAGHLAGIKRHLLDGTAPPDWTALDASPPKRVTAITILGWAIPLAFVVFFVWLGFTAQWQQLLEEAVAFVLITGLLSAAGCALALGHPWSILTAFVTAPFALLHPLVAAGWFSGLVEAKVRTPKVADFEAIKRVETLGQFWRNGVVRVLLVAAFTNVGNMVAAGFVGARLLKYMGGA